MELFYSHKSGIEYGASRQQLSSVQEYIDTWWNTVNCGHAIHLVFISPSLPPAQYELERALMGINAAVLAMLLAVCQVITSTVEGHVDGVVALVVEVREATHHIPAEYCGG